MSHSLIGNVVERSADSSNASSSKPTGISNTGFPKVQHRSQSAFARAREGKRRQTQASEGDEGQSRGAVAPPVVRSSSLLSNATTSAHEESKNETRTVLESADGLDTPAQLNQPLTAVKGSSAFSQGISMDLDLEQISRENMRRVETMTDEERERERVDILERFGDDVENLFKRIREKRTARNNRASSNEQTVHDNAPGGDTNTGEGALRERSREVSSPTRRFNKLHRPLSPSPSRSPHPSILVSRDPSRSSTPEPGSKPPRKLRFANVTEDDVYVYESQPGSPKKVAGLLGPPPDESEKSQAESVTPVIKLRSLNSRLNTVKPANDGLEAIPSSSYPSGVAPAPDEQPSRATDIDQPEEGTPEDIRRRFFPHLLPNDPSLEWIEGTTSERVEVSSAPSDPDESSVSQLPRFDLSGKPIPLNLQASLPTHLGLHHHASSELAGLGSAGDSNLAGYTLEDLLLLARSSVPAQRVTVLGVLSKIIKRISNGNRNHIEVQVPSNDGGVIGIPELKGKEDEVRESVLGVALEIMETRTPYGRTSLSIAVQAIQLFYECVVGWDEELVGEEVDVELKDFGGNSISSRPETDSAGESSSSRPDDLLSKTTLEALFSFISSQLAVHPTPVLPSNSLDQILAILYRLARHSNAIASEIVKQEGLVARVLGYFLPLPVGKEINSNGESRETDVRAIALLNTLAKASRENAESMLFVADSLLRFVAILPSPFPTSNISLNTASTSSPLYAYPLHLSLLTSTLQFYRTLASYGLYSHVSTTAQDQFRNLHNFALSLAVSQTQAHDRVKNLELSFVASWFELAEAWIVCAQDPHQTTPSHDILWSQIQGWGWAESLFSISTSAALRDLPPPTLLLSRFGHERSSWPIWSAAFNLGAAWLEGCHVNSVKNGADERSLVIQCLNAQFAARNSTAWLVVDASRARIQEFLRYFDGERGHLVENSELLRMLQEAKDAICCIGSFLRISLSCVPVPVGEQPNSEWTHFLQSFSPLVFDVLRLAHCQSWETRLRDSRRQLLQLMRFVNTLLLPFARIKPVIDDQAASPLGVVLSVLQRLLPGDEEYSEWILKNVLSSLGSRLNSEGGENSAGEFNVLIPFIRHTLRPEPNVYIGPIHPTPFSIKTASTLRLVTKSPPSQLQFGLPLPRRWPTCALDHLLRSGSSPVFNNISESWNPSETQIASASLLLASKVRDAISKDNTALAGYALRSDEAIFACMQVFMLEHSQNEEAGDSEEVYRDSAVEKRMNELLSPFTWSNSPSRDFSSARGLSSFSTFGLEVAAKSYLGPSTPFYQFYTDFVGLYDAVSFGHSQFARLLLPPTSMRYAIDYRKHLWTDYGHLLRTIRIRVEDVLVDQENTLNSYFWPVETDPEMLGAYLKGLSKGFLQEFMRWVAIHHVACNIWPDLQTISADSPKQGERSRLLLKAVTSQASHDVVKDVLRYQLPGGVPVPPPTCYGPIADLADSSPNVWSKRLDVIKEYGGEDMKVRLEGIFDDRR